MISANCGELARLPVKNTLRLAFTSNKPFVLQITISSRQNNYKIQLDFFPKEGPDLSFEGQYPILLWKSLDQKLFDEL